MRARGLMGLLMGPMRPMGLIGLMGHIGLMGLMGLGLMGCSGDSPEPAPEPAKAETAIAFASGLEEEQAVTRAAMSLSEQAVTRTTPLSEKTQRFTVWGYKNMSYDEDTQAYDSDGSTLQTVFPGYNVGWTSGSSATSTTNSNGWDYVNQLSSTGEEQTIKYWDWSAKAYRFFAVTGADGATAAAGTYVDNGVNGSTGAYEITLYANGSSEEGIAATPYYSHLWFSTGDPSSYADRQFGKPVQLEFLKPLSKVRFMFIYASAQEGVFLTDPEFKPSSDYDAVEASKVKIGMKGNVTVSYPLTGTETRESFSVSDIDVDSRLGAFTEAYISESNESWYTVLPNNTQGSYTLSVIINGETKYAAVPAVYMQWMPGYSYTYIFKINEEGGVEIESVQSAVTPWTTGNTTDHTVYNW